MFALFFSLYYSMFTGYWNNMNLNSIATHIKEPMSKLGELVTSIFGEFQVIDLGDYFTPEKTLLLVAFVLALITSIGIVVMAVKGIKRVFSIFFMGVR